MPIPTQKTDHLEWDIFLFGISNQAFMSKCKAVESNLTTAEIHQRFKKKKKKKIESSKFTAKHIIGGTVAATITQLHGKQQYQWGTNCKWANQNGDNSTVNQQKQPQQHHWAKQNSHPKQSSTTDAERSQHTTKPAKNRPKDMYEMWQNNA